MKHELTIASKNAIVPNISRDAEKIVLLVDISGSMDHHFENTTRLQAARQAVMTILSSSRPAFSAYGLVEFETSASLRYPISSNFSDLQRYRPRQDGGGTGLDHGLEVSLLEAPNRIILLTDGQPTCSRERIWDLVAKAIAMKTKIDTIAIGEAGDELLIEIASRTGGTFSRCASPQKLAEKFKMLETRSYLRLTHNG